MKTAASPDGLFIKVQEFDEMAYEDVGVNYGLIMNLLPNPGACLPVHVPREVYEAPRPGNRRARMAFSDWKVDIWGLLDPVSWRNLR